MTQSRIQKLRGKMEQLQLDAVFITNAVNRKYLTGFTGSSGYVVITSERAVLLTDFRYREQAPKQAPAYEVVEHSADPLKSVAEVLGESKATRVGFEAEDVTFHLHEQMLEKVDVTWVPATQMVATLRMIKDEDEINILKDACELADRTYAHILQYMKPGVTEQDIALEMEFYMRKNGASSSAFDMIVASGERSALPHGTASARVLQRGEFVTLDFGAVYNGYCSDITRTVVIGEPQPKHKEIYDIVLEAQMNALQHLKPGMTGFDADRLTREIIKEYGYNDYFGHGTGHGIGMEVHEEPRLSPRGNEVLQAGMTVTVEPGIYIPGFGGVRIEDDVLITETGIEILTRADKEFTVLD